MAATTQDKLIWRQAALGFSLLCLAGLAWARTYHDTQNMNCVMTMPEMHGPWWIGGTLYMASWAVMMAAMMLPAIMPMVLLFARVSRSRSARASTTGPWLFVLGYALVWSALGLPAYFGTLGLQAVVAHNPAAVGWLPKIGAVTLLAAGVYQLSPLKNACLKHCTSPLHFILHSWHDGHLGAIRMGVTHGAICAACCVGLMAVLFALGIMSLMWMAVVAIIIVAERTIAGGIMVSRITGGALALAGASALFIPEVARLLLA
jgi:predicted metal-binding membrane protein